MTISFFLMWQGCGSSSKMTLVLTSGENKNLQMLTFFIKRQICLFVVLPTTAKKWTKVKNTRAGRAKLWFLPTKYANLWRSCCRRRCRCHFLNSPYVVKSKRLTRRLGHMAWGSVRQCGPVVRALALRSGDPGFKTRSDHSLNLFLVVPGSTSRLHL